MDDVKNVLWKVVNNEAPLVEDDIKLYHIKEGILTDDDFKKWREAVRLLREAYYNSYKNKREAIEKVKQSLDLINSINPKKPMPPEMKIRFEDLKKNLELILKTNK
ncbi:hypothetical protein V6M85_09530 [Sulfolobus tengchongensis]|uniref:Uncharacterized protein n=1 Tax=Sulfolobus tengchongensis TaxID=207809 RepID=A0AAX4KZK2_9CREN